MVRKESFQGFAAERLCGNCAHFDCGPRKKDGGPARKQGICRNGVSGWTKIAATQGCGHGFYPDPRRWVLGAGPGGVFRKVER